MKKVLKLTLGVSVMVAALTGCGGVLKDCSVCAETAICEKVVVEGKVLYVCDDCMDIVDKLIENYEKMADMKDRFLK
ncbi:MAG: hypothetical protein E7541_08000 [Ruminococcaceae bacterium]|nr:hypothetical protein [Oscillospiraceae bacterium]